MRGDKVGKLLGIALLVATTVALCLRTIEHPSWPLALGAALVLLAARIAGMARSAAQRALPWSRLLLPTLVLVEGIGWSRAAALPWSVRLGTALLLELAVVVVAIRELRRRPTRTDAWDPVETRIAGALAALVPPPLARIAAIEVVIVGMAVRFLLGGWRRDARSALPHFTYHRESGLRMLLVLLPLLAVGDALLLELVILPHAAPWLRVAMHAAGLYGLVWLVGVYASMRARPHSIVEGRLRLHRGILRSVEVPLAAIESIAPLPTFDDDWKQRAYLRGALRLDVAGGAAFELRLRTAVRPLGMFGIGAAGTRVIVAVDDPAGFASAIA